MKLTAVICLFTDITTRDIWLFLPQDVDITTADIWLFAPDNDAKVVCLIAVSVVDMPK